MVYKVHYILCESLNIDIHMYIETSWKKEENMKAIQRADILEAESGWIPKICRIYSEIEMFYNMQK